MDGNNTEQRGPLTGLSQVVRKTKKKSSVVESVGDLEGFGRCGCCLVRRWQEGRVCLGDEPKRA